MGLTVIGHDPADATSHSEEDLLARADVLLFSAPIRHTPALIERYIAQSAGREAGKLWLDITSVKTAPVRSSGAAPPPRLARVRDGGLRGAHGALETVAVCIAGGVGGRMCCRHTRAT